MMSEKTRKAIDEHRQEIREIGAALKGLRQELDDLDRIKSGPRNEIDLDAWKQADEVRAKIRDCKSRRDTVQAELNDLLRPFRADKVIPALRKKEIAVKDLIKSVKAAIPEASEAADHLHAALDDALALADDGQALGRLLDLFLFKEIRGPVCEILGIEIGNGNGG